MLSMIYSLNSLLFLPPVSKPKIAPDDVIQGSTFFIKDNNTDFCGVPTVLTVDNIKEGIVSYHSNFKPIIQMLPLYEFVQMDGLCQSEL